MHSIIIFASGAGTNTTAIINHFKNNGKAYVSLIVSNKTNAGVLDIARLRQIPFLIVDKKTLHESLLINQLQSYRPSLIVLAGFLWKIPPSIIDAFKGQIINIHPALLPEHGGKGMYGNEVHQAVLAAKKNESGITIHYADEQYDNGNIILQARCKIKEGDTEKDLAARIHRLEHFYYPRVIEFLLDDMKTT